MKLSVLCYSWRIFPPRFLRSLCRFRCVYPLNTTNNLCSRCEYFLSIWLLLSMLAFISLSIFQFLCYCFCFFWRIYLITFYLMLCSSNLTNYYFWLVYFSIKFTLLWIAIYYLQRFILLFRFIFSSKFYRFRNVQYCCVYFGLAAIYVC